MLHFLRMRRRRLLQLISVGALSPGFNALCAAEACRAIHAGPSESYQLRFFRPDENELLDALMEMIIPADAHSLGAREAKVTCSQTGWFHMTRWPRSRNGGPACSG